MDRAFVDTNVLVYLFDDTSPRKRDTVRKLVAARGVAGALVVSTQVLLELHVVLTRKRRPPMAPADAEELVRTLAEWTVVQTDVGLVLAALARARKETISTWDALIVEAARVAGCRTLLTEDLQAERVFDDVTVVNPFAKA
ncbi:MAG: PIN domain-containing protein [Phycisphaerales bacterium]